MDKTMIVWTPPPSNDITDDEDAENIWSESVRVGEVGGNVLGFLGGQFAPRRRSDDEGRMELLGHSFNGALHSWVRESEDGMWSSGVATSGHFGPVEDLDWHENGR